MIRRSFLSSLGALLSGLWRPKNQEMRWRRIFRFDSGNNEWREIAFGEMRPGDRVLALSLDKGHLSELGMWDIRSIPEPTEDHATTGNWGVEVAYAADILKKVVEIKSE